MNIGIVLSTTPAYSETFFLSKIKGLKTSGFDVTLFVQKAHADFDLCPVIVAPKVYKTNPVFQTFAMSYNILRLLIYFPKRFFKFINYERQAKRSWIQILKNFYTNSHLFKANLDWIHFGFATIAIQSEHVAKAIGAKMAVSLRGFDIDVYPKAHPHCYDLVFKQIDKVHSISQYLLGQAYDLGLSQQKPYSIITPAIDIKVFHSTSVRQSNPVQFLTIARLHWIKGLEDTLRAMALVKKELEFKYTIVGEGPDHAHLLDLIHKLGLSQQVFLEGKRSHEEVVSYLKKAQLYIQYSESEGFCNAVLEAQAMGCLCVVSDGGALPENIIDGKTGWIVPKKNPVKLSKKILEVLRLPEQEQLSISVQAQQRIQKDFNLEKQQQEFADFYSN